ncbi:4Fe-4S binding protein [bacterium]|nr:MAG: 4Fe-4S binding protein [bacterium]
MSRKINVNKYRLALGVLVPLVIIGGFFSPYFGYAVPFTMIGAMAMAFSGRGRRFCGNYCPRGSFLDTWLRHLPSFKLKLPPVNKVRWYVTAGLMGLMVWRIAKNPTDLAYLGGVFWMMCLVTTGAALILAVLYRQRAWCMICPIGTVSTVLKKTTHTIPVPEGCTSCKLCDKACPIALKPSEGIICSTECLQCGVCTAVCPKTRKKKAA